LSHAEQHVDFFRHNPDCALSAAAGTVIGSTRCFVVAFAMPQNNAIHCLQKIHMLRLLLPADHALVISRYQKKLFSQDYVKIKTRAKTSSGCCFFKILTGICAMPILCAL